MRKKRISENILNHAGFVDYRTLRHYTPVCGDCGIERRESMYFQVFTPKSLPYFEFTDDICISCLSRRLKDETSS